jgi:hypothetical protein
MCYGHPPRTDHVWEGAYIDDRAVMAMIRGPSARANEEKVANLVLATEAAYSDAGLVRHAAKQLRNAETAAISGCSLIGANGSHAVTRDAAKLAQVVGVALLALAEVICTGRVLRRLAGLWVHRLLCRRAYLRILEELFRFR